MAVIKKTIRNPNFKDYNALMSSLLLKKLNLVCLLALSFLAGLMGLALIFLEDPKAIAAQELHLSHMLQKEHKAEFHARARSAYIEALKHDPYNAALWAGFSEMEKNLGGLAGSEARLIAQRLDPKVGSSASKEGKGGQL